VTASGSTEDDLSAGEFKNVATTTVTLRFWNVGSLAPGYGEASMKSRVTFTGHPAIEEAVCGGTFTGGPNGSFRIACDEEPFTLRLLNGSVVDAPGLRLTVGNPGAFNNWPKEF
jgi:hypothetical protein